MAPSAHGISLAYACVRTICGTKGSLCFNCPQDFASPSARAVLHESAETGWRRQGRESPARLSLHSCAVLVQMSLSRRLRCRLSLPSVTRFGCLSR